MSQITTNKGIFKHLQDFHSKKKEKVCNSRQVRSYRLKSLERMAQLLSSQNGVSSIIYTYVANTKGPNSVSGIAFGENAKKILASQQAIEFSMYFRKSFSQKEKTTCDFDDSESEPLAITNADLQEQSKCDKAITCIQPSEIQGNEESISETEPFHPTSLIHGVEVSKQKKATKNDSGTNPKSAKSRRLLKVNENKRLRCNTQPKSRSVSPNNIRTGETIKIAVKRKNVTKVLNKNRCTDTIFTSSSTVSEEFPGTHQICLFEIAVEPGHEPEKNENEESSSYSDNNISTSTRIIRGIEVSNQKDAAKISTSDTNPKSSMKLKRHPLSPLNGNIHIESKTLGKECPRKKTVKSKKVKASTIKACHTEPILTTLDENEDFDRTEETRDKAMPVDPIQNNCSPSEIVEDVTPTNKGELTVGTKILKPNWITEIDNNSDSESLNCPLLQLSGHSKHITQQKIQCIRPKANKEGEIFPVIRTDKRKDSKVSSNYLPTKKRFKLV